jgi:hypothetical protein
LGKGEAKDVPKRLRNINGSFNSVGSAEKIK